MNQSLPTAILGRTGLQVTRLGWGTGHRKMHLVNNDDQRKAIHNTVLDLGINYIDTGHVYGTRKGYTYTPRSEGLIGDFLSHRSSEFYLATKCGDAPATAIEGIAGHIWTKENCFRCLHESLQSLKTDCVDLMQLHSPSVEECERGRLVEALEEMRAQGKVRWIGVSIKGKAEGDSTIQDLPTYLSWGVFDVFQMPYSALEREHEDWITKVAEAGAGTVIRQGVALGEPGIGSGEFDGSLYPKWRKFGEAKLDELREEGESRTAFMLRFTLTHPHANTIIVGTNNPDHARENAQAVLRGPLPADVYNDAKRRLQRVGVQPQPVA